MCEGDAADSPTQANPEGVKRSGSPKKSTKEKAAKKAPKNKNLTKKSRNLKINCFKTTKMY
jgi:hypothetical protein